MSTASDGNHAAAEPLHVDVAPWDRGATSPHRSSARRRNRASTDVPGSAVVAGNPGRVVRFRVADRRAAERIGMEADLRRWVNRARADVAGILERAFVDGTYRDRPEAPQPTVRAHCDAVELADLLLSRPPPQLPSADHVARLRASQDRRSGLVAEIVDRR